MVHLQSCVCCGGKFLHADKRRGWHANPADYFRLALTAGWIDRQAKNISHQETICCTERNTLAVLPTRDEVGRCANGNSASRCNVGIILAGDDAAYDGLRWSSHFASSDATKENQNEGNVSYRSVVARAIYFRV
jgi:hypothetical protein